MTVIIETGTAWRRAGPTIADKMILYDNRSRGFDYLRLGLSLAVLVWHCFFLTVQPIVVDGAAHFVIRMILPMFFALSGFLISGSVLRTRTMREFVTLRAIRIMPALAVEVLLSALVIGAMLTTLPLGDYFTHPTFFIYFNNLYGHVQFFLPGVFEKNPTHLINVSMWTIPYELYCYVAIVILWFAGALPKRRLVLLALVVAAQVALPVRDLISGDMIDLARNNVPGRLLLQSFLFGVVLYFFSERIVLRAWIAVAAVVLCWALFQSSLTAYFVPLPVAYITVFLGLTNPPKIPVLMDGDYSYGIYLYAVPIQQTVVALFPGQRVWWFTLLASIVPICLFAAFSWHVVEKPFLGRRKAIIAAMLRLSDAVGDVARRRIRLPTPRQPVRRGV